MGALVLEDLHQRCAVGSLLADRLVIQDHAAHVLGDARRAEQHLAIRAPVVLGVLDADRVEPSLDGAGALVRGEDALAGGDQCASDLGDICHGRQDSGHMLGTWPTTSSFALADSHSASATSPPSITSTSTSTVVRSSACSGRMARARARPSAWSSG